MPTLRELTEYIGELCPFGERGTLVATTLDGIEIRHIEEEKEIVVVKPIPCGIPEKDKNSLKKKCEKLAIKKLAELYGEQKIHGVVFRDVTDLSDNNTIVFRAKVISQTRLRQLAREYKSFFMALKIHKQMEEFFRPHYQQINYYLQSLQLINPLIMEVHEKLAYIPKISPMDRYIFNPWHEIALLQSLSPVLETHRMILEYHQIVEKPSGFFTIPHFSVDEIKKSIKREELRLRKKYPRGYKWFKLYQEEDPSFYFKIREYTRKLLVSFNISYRDDDINMDLFSKNFDSLPDDIFIHYLCKALPIKKSRYLVDIVKDLEKLPFRVRDSFKYYSMKRTEEKLIYSIDQDKLDNGLKEDLGNLMNDSLVIAMLEEALRELTPKQREVIELRIQGLTNAEIARHLSITRESVGERLEAAKARLKRKFRMIISN